MPRPRTSAKQSHASRRQQRTDRQQITFRDPYQRTSRGPPDVALVMAALSRLVGPPPVGHTGPSAGPPKVVPEGADEKSFDPPLLVDEEGNVETTECARARPLDLLRSVRYQLDAGQARETSSQSAPAEAPRDGAQLRQAGDLPPAAASSNPAFAGAIASLVKSLAHGSPLARVSTGRPVRLRVKQSYTLVVANTAAARLLTFASSDPSVFLEWANLAAFFSGVRCLSLAIHFVAIDEDSAGASGNILAMSPDVDGTAAPADFDAVITRANEFKIFPFCFAGGSPRMECYHYRVPDAPPYNQFSDTGSSPGPDWGVIQIASQSVAGAPYLNLRGVVVGEFEYVNRN